MQAVFGGFGEDFSEEVVLRSLQKHVGGSEYVEGGGKPVGREWELYPKGRGHSRLTDCQDTG